MEVQTATDPAKLTETEEKHIPIIEIEGTEVVVKIGKKAHPMEEDHFIEWIELYQNSHLLSRKNLRPGRKPETLFHLRGEEGSLYAIAFCNKHGAWQSEEIF
ncbi:MAG: hypothetical protein E3J54_06260 [Actinobacteria bacterium]|nr:MAG: hypothetical protein E3J54_06260 [Actinomycetota bacterium]